MRYLKSLIFFACFLFSSIAIAQSSPQTFSRIRDGALPNNLANVYFAQQKYDEAIEEYHRACTSAHREHRKPEIPLPVFPK